MELSSGKAIAGLVDYESSDSESNNENQEIECDDTNSHSLLLQKNQDLTTDLVTDCVEMVDDNRHTLMESQKATKTPCNLNENGSNRNCMTLTYNRISDNIAPRSVAFNSDSCSHPKQRKLDERTSSEKKLGVPAAIQSMFSGHSVRQWIDDPHRHADRVRSFPHVEGNWATHVYIEVPWNQHLFEMVSAIMEILKPFEFHAMPEFHVSLSRTVVIRHHWIDPLVESLRANLNSMQTSVCDLCDVKLFTNDEKTRTFMSFKISEEDTAGLKEYVKAVDTTFSEFKLQTYYDNPSFHISVGWCLGDMTQRISHERILHAKKLFGECLAVHPELSVLYAQAIHCRTGNKIAVIPLLEKG